MRVGGHVIKVTYCLPSGTCEFADFTDEIVHGVEADARQSEAVEQQSHFGGGYECVKIPAGLWILAFDAGKVAFGEIPDMPAEKFRGGKLFELISYGFLGRQLAWIFQLVFTGKFIEYLPHGQAMSKVAVAPQHLEDFEGGVPCIGFALRRLVCIHTLRLPRASSRMEVLG